MTNTRKLIGAAAIVLPFGLVAYAVGSWFYLYLTDPENAPSITDLPGLAISYIRRGGLIVQGKASSDARTIAVGLIAGFEGFSSKAYPDPKGQTKTYSIGYGHQIVPGDGFDTSSIISESDANGLLFADIDTYASCVDGAVTAELTPNQLAALYSFTYNEGCHAFKTSTLLKLINGGDLEGASQEFERWDYAGGEISAALVDRRGKESELFMSDIQA